MVRRPDEDPDEDLELPEPVPLFRMCSTEDCRGHAREGGRDCPGCHAETTRRWRATHRKALNARRRGRAESRSAEARRRDIARATLAMALRRGKLKRGWCTVCADRTVTAYQPDPERPLEVVWVCRRDREAVIDGLARERERMAERDVWRRRVERCERELPLLPPDLQAEVRKAASLGVPGTVLSPRAPLYGMNLVRAFERCLATRE